MPSVVHGHSKQFFDVVVVGIANIGGRVVKWMFESIALRARFANFASARSKLNKPAVKILDPKKLYYYFWTLKNCIKTNMRISENVSAV